MEHVPVLLDEVLAHLVIEERSPLWVLDGTFGRGGHSRAIMKKYPEVSLIGLDRDLDAIDYGKDHFSKEISEGRLQLIHCNYVDVEQKKAELLSATGNQGFDAILLDLGVSSPQLDQGQRGFSFYHDVHWI